MFKIKVTLLTLISCLQIGGVSAQTSNTLNLDNLTLDEIIKIALVTNPEVKSFAKNIDLAVEDIDLAKANYRPNIQADASINYVRVNNDIIDEWQSDTSKNIGFDLTQPIFRGWRTESSVSQQETIRNAVEYQFQDFIQLKIVDIVDAYMTAFREKRALDVNLANVELLEEELKATNARFEAGELTKTDVSQAEARLAQAIAEENASRAFYQVALSGFREETGIDEKINIAYPDILMDELPQTLDMALSIGRDKNPEILASTAQIEADKYGIEGEKGRFYPEVNLGAAYDKDRNPTFSTFRDQDVASLSLRASLPIYQSGIIRNQVRQAKIRAAQSKDELTITQRAVTDNIISSWERFLAIDLQIKARQAQLTASQQAYEGVALEEEVGARSVLDVLDASQDVKNAELSLIDARRDMVVAYYQLLDAIGTLGETLWDKF